jgi:FemAB-related protein (PEP-CTERM system-associated)
MSMTAVAAFLNEGRGAPTARGVVDVFVRRFRPGDEARWDAFVADCTEATFFHWVGWRDLIENEFRHRCHYLLAERDGTIVGVLPLVEMRSRLFGHALVSLPFAVYGGPVAVDDVSRNALINAASEMARSLGVEYLELRNRDVFRADWPRQEIYVTFRKTIAPDADSNLNAIPRKQRAMVRKGIKHGLRSELDTTPRRFFALYADNMLRHGTPPFSIRYFERLLATFPRACEVLTVVDATGNPLSSVLSFYFRDQVLPYYAGDTATARDFAANDFKYWELMRRACERGVRVFDYGRSKRGTGAFDFKKNWGFEPKSLAYEYQLLSRDAIPQNNPLNPKFRAFIALWRRLPLPLANALGPAIVRSLG